MHEKRDHPKKMESAATTSLIQPSTSALLIKKRVSATVSSSREKRFLDCNQCDYRSTRLRHLKEHKEKHEIQSAHGCPLCNYSCRQKVHLKIHLSRHHVKKEADESSPQPPQKKRSITSEMPTKSMRRRIEVMKEKVRLAKEDFESISAKTEDVIKKKEKAQRRMDQAHAALRTKEFEALQFFMKLLRSTDYEAAKTECSKAKKEVFHFSLEHELRVAKYNALQEQERLLYIDLESANSSRYGAQQVLDILEAELENLETCARLFN